MCIRDRFWGETPTLHVSKDDGETWTDFVFQEEYPRLCTSRIVRFLDPENGYVGLGTDWSMGTGGATYIGWTHDGGATWETTPVAVENGWILSGLAFADQSAGMLTMDEQFGENSWPQDVYKRQRYGGKSNRYETHYCKNADRAVSVSYTHLRLG